MHKMRDKPTANSQFLGAVLAPLSQRMEIHGSAHQDEWYLVAQLFTIRQAG